MKIDKLMRNIIPIIIVMLITGCGEPPAEQAEAANPAGEISVVVPVEVMDIKSQTVTQEVKLSGIVTPVNAADIIAEVNGEVEKVVKKLGDKVTTSDTLAFIDDTIPLANYLQAKSRVLSAENNLSISRLNLKSDEELFANGDISKLAFQTSQLAVKSAEADLLSAKANLSLLKKAYFDTRITSPINGVISRKYINVGTMVNPGLPLYGVVDLSALKIEAGVAQNIIEKVSVGSKAELTISGLDNQTFRGAVKHMSPQADAATGAFTIEIHFKNTPDMKILAGMAANVKLMLASMEEMISVPDHAIVMREGERYVYKVEGSIAKLTPIVSNGTYGANVLIAEGVNEGDQIVVVGMKNLGIDTKIRIEEEN